ncbi:MAG: hypothetical protein HFF52_08845 [Lawsonibacter sp.]|nr:hypothetical protein [Lawsonibacter sp.]
MNQNRKRWVAVTAAALALLACTGVAMAVLHTNMGAKDNGVQFSNDYPQYVEKVTGQVIGDQDADPGASPSPKTELEKLDLQTNGDGIQVALESYLCDEGFLDLQFRVKISGEKLDAFRSEENSDWEVPLTYLSFNDPVMERDGVKYVQQGGANYTLNVDGQDIWLRGRTAQSIDKVGAGEYVIQQMWFLGEDVLGSKDTFHISLGSTAIGLGENCISMEGGFDLSVSKSKAAAATSVITLKDNSWSPRPGVTKTVEKVSQTPLQSIFRIRSVYTGVSSEQLNIDSWDYLVYQANGQAQAAYSARTAAEIVYADGTAEQLTDPGEYDFSRQHFEGATFITEEIIATAPVSGSVVLRAYDSDYAPDYRMTVAAEYQVDLSAGTVAAKTVDTIIYDAGTGEMDDEYSVFYKLRYGQDVSETQGNQAQAFLDEWMRTHGGELVSELD